MVSVCISQMFIIACVVESVASEARELALQGIVMPKKWMLRTLLGYFRKA